MKNLDQIRAATAIAHRQSITSSQNGGDAISGFPMLILTDGLLATLAFACEEKEVQRRDVPEQNHPNRIFFRQVGQGNNAKHLKRKHEGEFTIARAITAHLRATGIDIVTVQDPDALITHLAAQESDHTLRRATAEAIQFLNYLKRFVA